MAAAMYRIGPSDFFTPGDLEADAQTLDAQVKELDVQVQARATQDFAGAWEAWVGGWNTFRDGTFGGWLSSFLSSFNDANRDALISYENQFATWAQQAQAQAIQVPGPVVAPSTGAQDTLGAHAAAQGLPSGGTLVALVVAVVVLLVVMKVGT